MNLVVIHIDRSLSSYLAQHILGEFHEGFSIVTTVKYLVVNQPLLLADGANDSN